MDIAVMISALAGFAIPHLKDLLLHWQAPSWLKSSLIWLLSVLSGALTQVAFSGDWSDYLFSILAAMAVAAGTDYLSGQDTDKPGKPMQRMTRGKGMFVHKLKAQEQESPISITSKSDHLNLSTGEVRTDDP